MTSIFPVANSTGYAVRSSANPRFLAPCLQKRSGCRGLYETQPQSKRLQQNTRDIHSILGYLTMKVLFIGGTGTVSAAVSHQAIAKGFDLYLLNRGLRRLPLSACHCLTADIHQPAAVRESLRGLPFYFGLSS